MTSRPIHWRSPISRKSVPKRSPASKGSLRSFLPLHRAPNELSINIDLAGLDSFEFMVTKRKRRDFSALLSRRKETGPPRESCSPSRWRTPQPTWEKEGGGTWLFACHCFSTVIARLRPAGMVCSSSFFVPMPVSVNLRRPIPPCSTWSSAFTPSTLQVPQAEPLLQK